MMVKEIRETVHTRLEAGLFPLPTEGLSLPVPSGQQTIAEIDTTGIKDSTLRATVDKAIAAFNSGDTAEGLRQLNFLDVQLSQRKMSAAQAKNQELIAAINNNNDYAAQKAAQELFNMLSKV
jgi:propanediol dehydratase large subunit